jgi:hypothetical protein
VSRRTRWLTASTATVLLAIGVGVAGFVLSRDDRSGCLSNLAYEDPASHVGIESVVASTLPPRVYVTTGEGKLSVGTESQHLRWRTLSVHPPGRLMASNGADVLYAAWNALFHSDDGGHSWRRLTCGLHVNDVAVASPQVLYLATAQSLIGGDGGGLYRTLDGGTNWKRFTTFTKRYVDQQSVEVVTANPSAPRTVYVGREFGGVEYSKDGGEHWRFSKIAKAGNGLDGPQVTSFGWGTDRRTLWAGTRFRGIYAADATRLKWSTKGLKGRYIDQVLPSERLARVIYAITDGEALRTVDGGVHWRVMKGLPNRILGLTSRPDGSALFAWSRTTLYWSRDAGDTWKTLRSYR